MLTDFENDVYRKCRMGLSRLSLPKQNSLWIQCLGVINYQIFLMSIPYCTYNSNSFPFHTTQKGFFSGLDFLVSVFKLNLETIRFYSDSFEWNNLFSHKTLRNRLNFERMEMSMPLSLSLSLPMWKSEQETMRNQM